MSDFFNSIYTLQPPTRLEDFAAMKITTETDPQKLKKQKKNNVWILNNNNPSQFVYNKFKTYIIMFCLSWHSPAITRLIKCKTGYNKSGPRKGFNTFS